MDWTWINSSLDAVLMVALSTLGIYISLILLTRLIGLRSFSKMSSFDFAVTVAIGSVIASTIVAPDPPLVQGAIALAALYGLQMFVGVVRTHWAPARHMVDNEPLLLMVGTQILQDHMHKAQVTEADLKAKLREANVIDRRQIRAVVMESTGDISVLHAAPEDPPLEPWLLDGVRGADLLSTPAP